MEKRQKEQKDDGEITISVRKVKVEKRQQVRKMKGKKPSESRIGEEANRKNVEKKMSCSHWSTVHKQIEQMFQNIRICSV